MFVGKENVEVVLFYKQAGTGNLRVETSLKDVPKNERDQFKKLVLGMRPLTWKKYNEVQRQATVDKGVGRGGEIDWVLYKEKKLLSILVEWDAKTEEGKPILVNQENIFKLHPMIAEMSLNEFDRKTLLGEEEQGN